MALMARAYNQAQKFGAEWRSRTRPTSLVVHDGDAASFTLNLQSGERVRARYQAPLLLVRNRLARAATCRARQSG
jgi:hypothetical protein